MQDDSNLIFLINSKTRSQWTKTLKKIFIFCCRLNKTSLVLISLETKYWTLIKKINMFLKEIWPCINFCFSRKLKSVKLYTIILILHFAWLRLLTKCNSRKCCLIWEIQIMSKVLEQRTTYYHILGYEFFKDNARVFAFV